MKPAYLAPLYDDWNPPTLLHRDKELRQILRFTVELPAPQNLWIEGEKGLGKTLTCKFFAQEVKARNAGAVVYIQCGSSFNQSAKAACEREGVHVPFRALNPYGIVSTLLKQRPGEAAYYFVIDDPERVRDTRSIDNFVRDVYNILNYHGKRHAVLMVTRMSLKRAYSVFEVLKADSRLHPTPIIFQPYSAGEIVQIFKQRLHYAFTRDDVYDEDALYTIAQHIWMVGSDVREALEILRHAVLDVAEDRLTKSDAVEAVDWAKKGWWREKMLSLPPHWAFLIYVAAKNARRAEEGIVEIKAHDAIDIYKLCARDLNIDPLGKTTIYYALKKMSETEGFFTLEKERPGKIEILKLRFDEEEAKRITQAGDELDWRFTLY